MTLATDVATFNAAQESQRALLRSIRAQVAGQPGGVSVRFSNNSLWQRSMLENLAFDQYVDGLLPTITKAG